MKTARNRVLVKKTEKSRWIDTIETESGVTLYTAPLSEVATNDIKYWGEVVAVPGTLTGYRKNDTKMRLMVGDFVYFNYKTLMRDPLTKDEEGNDLWEVDYSDIFCFVDEGGIQPIGDWVFLEKIEHTEQLGTGVLINPNTTIKHGQAKVYAISPAVDLKKEEGWIWPGDEVIFKHEEGAFENTIEGKKFWLCPADIILAYV